MCKLAKRGRLWQGQHQNNGSAFMQEAMKGMMDSAAALKALNALHQPAALCRQEHSSQKGLLTNVA